MARPRQSPKGRPRQLSVYVTEEAWRRLAALQKHYAARAGLPSSLTQPDTLEIVLRETATREGVEPGKRGAK